MKHEVKQELLDQLLNIMRTIVICMVVLFLCFKLFLKPIQVSGASMYPTLKDGDFGFTFVLGGLLDIYERFDVVIIYYEAEDMELVKRIIGLPGETILYKDNKLYVNGEYVEETFFNEDFVDSQTFGQLLNFTEDFGPVTLGEDEYFVLGDNRRSSLDSRIIGAIHSEDILSKYVYVIYPFDDFNIVTNDD